MPFRKDIQENLRFLILEVKSQLQDALRVLKDPDSVSIEHFVARDDYIDNLKGVIETKSFTHILGNAELDKSTIDLIKAGVVITSNLERIADFAVNVVRQTQYLHKPQFMLQYDVLPFFDQILEPLDKVYDAAITRNIQMGLQICRAEYIIDTLYADAFKDILDQLRKGKDIEDLLTAIFIFRYLERIGDSLLNIGEAIISSAMGEKLKIHQVKALEETLHDADMGTDLESLSFQSIWETRSGCRIARIQNQRIDGKPATNAIFKEGRLKKLQEEKKSIERWQTIDPTLAPKIFSYQEHGDNGSVLLEYFSGSTFKDILFEEDDANLLSSQAALTETLERVWTQTMKPGEINARYISQLLDRIRDVHKVHPDYEFPGDQIGSLTMPSFVDLLRAGLSLDQKLSAPFSVYIHGDLNVDNIIISQNDLQVHFIDLHRSRDTDYVQDISVFLISNYRLPVSDSRLRSRIDRVIADFYEFGKRFADKHNDHTYDARLTLGLIRNFASSTRFELSTEFAKAMYLRAAFLLEKLMAHEGTSWDKFKIPREAMTT